MRVPPGFMERIDAWRAKQGSPIPSRAEAIRILVDKALKLDKKG